MLIARGRIQHLVDHIFLLEIHEDDNYEEIFQRIILLEDFLLFTTVYMLVVVDYSGNEQHI